MSAPSVPQDLLRRALVGHHDAAFTVRRAHEEVILIAPYVEAQLAHHRIVPQEVSELRVVVEVVDRYHFDVGALVENAEDAPTDPAEAVDPHSDAHRPASSAPKAASRSPSSTARKAYAQPLSNQVSVFATRLPTTMVA